MSAGLTGLVAAAFGLFNRGAPRGVSEIDKALNDLCRPTLDKETRRPQRIPDSQFADISEALKNYEAAKKVEGWHRRPRIFTFLHQIRRLDVMHKFIGHGLTDSCIPFEEHDLPSQLGQSRHAFMRFQDLVLTNAKDLELGIEGKRRFFNTSADDHFWKLGYLGSGGSGDVEKVLSRLSLKIYARKKFRRTGNNGREWARKHKHFDQEITALKRLRHMHLVEIVGSYTDQKLLAFLMKPVADCNLLTFLQHYQNDSNPPNLRSFFGCLANTIAYLHSQKVYHMDLKPENILVLNGDLYVADFGSAHDWSKQENSTAYSTTPRTARYQPPELARNPFAPRNWAADIWSIGIVFLEMTTVLRGKTIQAFRAHLNQNGSGRAFVYDNAAATASWTEIPRTSEGPDHDNEPLMWIYGMTRPTSSDRPRASKVLELILESSAGDQFRRSCCAQRIHDSMDISPDATQTRQTFNGNGDGDDEDLIRALLASDHDSDNAKPQALPESSQ